MNLKGNTAIFVIITVALVATIAYFIGQRGFSPPSTTTQDAETAQEKGSVQKGTTEEEKEVEEQSVEPEGGTTTIFPTNPNLFQPEYSPCTSDANCGENMYCLKTSCSDSSGVCALKPETCATIVVPVCGCDDFTYSNACKAMRAGVNVSKHGSCS